MIKRKRKKTQSETCVKKFPLAISSKGYNSTAALAALIFRLHAGYVIQRRRLMCRSLHSSADSSLSSNPTGQQPPSTRGTGTEVETVKRTLDVIHSLVSEAFFRKARSSEPFCFCIPAAVSMCVLASFHFVSLSSCLCLLEENLLSEMLGQCINFG